MAPFYSSEMFRFSGEFSLAIFFDGTVEPRNEKILKRTPFIEANEFISFQSTTQKSA